MRVFLSGMMGTGKSTVGGLLADELGVAFVDLDERVSQLAGQSVDRTFSLHGEDKFRAFEAQALDVLLTEERDCVVALGGGTVTRDDTRRRLLEAGTLISLTADAAELARRCAGGAGRPLLEGGDMQGRLASLLEQRAPAYAECHGSVDTEGKAPSEVAAAAARIARSEPIAVPLGLRSYSVEVGWGVRAELMGQVAHASNVVLVSDESVGPLWGRALRNVLSEHFQQTGYIEIGAGESHKHIRSVERIWKCALDGGVDRSSLLVGVGGGVVGDLAGFAAATLLRGIEVGHLPTTLLSMVDSSVGGKTGFDTEHGKNLVGAFHQPRFVLCDIEMLDSLPPPERRAGLAEVVKSAWLAGEAQVASLEQEAHELDAGEPAATERAVRMSVSLKASVVSADERESGKRALLNLGHTLGHAIEAAQGFQGVRHGEAVALGMVAAMDVALELGTATSEQRERLVRLLLALGLPHDPKPSLDKRALEFVAADKKRRGKQLAFVSPAEPGAVGIAPIPLNEFLALVARLYDL